MPRKGENIRKRKDGRWEGRFKRGIKEDGTIDYGSVYGKSYKEVKDKLLLAKHSQEKVYHPQTKRESFLRYFICGRRQIEFV